MCVMSVTFEMCKKNMLNVLLSELNDKVLVLQTAGHEHTHSPECQA